MQTKAECSPCCNSRGPGREKVPDKERRAQQRAGLEEDKILRPFHSHIKQLLFFSFLKKKKKKKCSEKKKKLRRNREASGLRSKRNTFLPSHPFVVCLRRGRKEREKREREEKKNRGWKSAQLSPPSRGAHPSTPSAQPAWSARPRRCRPAAAGQVTSRAHCPPRPPPHPRLPRPSPPGTRARARGTGRFIGDSALLCF